MGPNPSTEQQILEVAEKLFLDKGFALTTTTEIAKRVGCNQALVHYYFRTKENLFEKIFESKFTLFTSTISVKHFTDCDLKEIIEKIITKHLEIISANPKLPFLIINEVTTNPVKFQNIVAKLKAQAIPVITGLDELLKAEIEKGRIRSITAFDLLLNILSLNIFMFLAKPILTGVREIPAEEYGNFILHRREEILMTIWRGIAI